MAQQRTRRERRGPALALASEHHRRLLLRRLAPLGVVAGTLLPYLPHFFFGTLPFEDDLANYFWPVMHRVAVVLGSGALPLWTSALYSGFPLFADSEAGTLFPLNWLLIVFNDPRGLLTVLWASLCVSALGMYAFARSLGAGRTACAIGAWCWSLGGFATGHLIHVSILNSTAPLPWLLLAVERVLATSGRARGRWLIAAAALHALQWLGGHVQPALMAWWLVGAYLVFRLFLSPTPGAPARSRPQRLVLLGAVPAFIGAVAFGLSAVQLLPTLELAAASVRGAGATYLYATSYSVSPLDLVALFSPFFFQHDSGVRWSLWAAWETAAYVGILPLMVALIGLLPSGRRLLGQAVGVATRERLFFGVIALVSLWLAMGDSAPLSPYRWVHALPLMNILRAPARFLMLFDFSLAVLAALGADRLLSAAQPFERVAARRLAIAIGSITLVLLCIVFGVAAWIGANREAAIQWLDSTYEAFPNAGLLHPPERLFDFLQWAVWLGNPRLSFAMLVLVAAALWTMSACMGGLQPRRRRLFAVVLVLADLSYFAYGFWQPVSVEDLAKPDAVVQLVRSHAAGTRVFSWPQSATQPDRLLRWDVVDAAGYSSLGMRHQSQLNAALITYDNRLLDLMSVGLIVLPPRAADTAKSSTIRANLPLDPRAPMLYIAQGSPSSQRTFVLGATPLASHLRIVSALEHAPQLEQGQEVAQLSILDAQNRRFDIPIRAGIETAEWALERPDVRAIARHQPAPIALSFEAIDDFSPSYVRHLYVADVPLAAGGGSQAPRTAVGEAGSLVPAGVSESITVSSIQATVELPGINWLIYRIELLTPSGEPAGGSRAPLLDRFDVSSYEPILDSPEARIYRNRTVLPRVRLVGQALVEVNPGRIFSRVVSPDFDPEQMVLLESMLQGVSGVGGSQSGAEPVSGTISLTQTSDSRLEVRVQTDRDAYLVLADTWYDGWKAYDNGQPVTIYRANGAQRAVWLAAGSHTVEFVFEPWAVRAGIVISLFSTVAAGLVWLAATDARGVRAASGRCA